MTESREAKYRRILDAQLAMNRQTWATLERHGITLADERHLDFMYSAPDERSADGLKDFLEDRTDYQLRPLSRAKIPGREWFVSGSTSAMPLSPERLDQWVDWMVDAGLDFGCEFDGWGTEA